MITFIGYVKLRVFPELKWANPLISITHASLDRSGVPGAGRRALSAGRWALGTGHPDSTDRMRLLCKYLCFGSVRDTMGKLQILSNRSGLESAGNVNP